MAWAAVVSSPATMLDRARNLGRLKSHQSFNHLLGYYYKYMNIKQSNFDQILKDTPKRKKSVILVYLGQKCFFFNYSLFLIYYFTTLALAY